MNYINLLYLRGGVIADVIEEVGKDNSKFLVTSKPNVFAEGEVSKASNEYSLNKFVLYNYGINQINAEYKSKDTSLSYSGLIGICGADGGGSIFSGKIKNVDKGYLSIEYDSPYLHLNH